MRDTHWYEVIRKGHLRRTAQLTAFLLTKTPFNFHFFPLVLIVQDRKCTGTRLRQFPPPARQGISSTQDQKEEAGISKGSQARGVQALLTVWVYVNTKAGYYWNRSRAVKLPGTLGGSGD